MTLAPPPTPLPTQEDLEPLWWEHEPAFLRPHESRALPAIMPTLLRVLGREVPGAIDLLGVLPGPSPRRAKRVFLLCLDGLGFHELAHMTRLSALHRDWGSWVTSVFPSITSSAITSIYQGLPPARHGILGHQIWKHLPGAVIDMLRMHVVGATQPLAVSGFDVRQWQREPGLLQSPATEGLRGVQLMPAAIAGSGLSAYCYGDSELVGFLEPMEGFAKAAHLLGEVDRGWVGLYLPTVDSLTHVFGSNAEPTRVAARQIEEGLSWMASRLSAAELDDTALMLVADHGQADITRRIPLEGEAWERIQSLSRAVGYSGRVLHVYLDDPERNRDEVLVAMDALLGDGGRAFPFEAVAGLTGLPLDASAVQAEWVRESLGDAVALLHDGVDWDKLRPDARPFPYGTPLVAHHGGMSPAEMLVPVVLGPLSAVLGG